MLQRTRRRIGWAGLLSAWAVLWESRRATLLLQTPYSAERSLHASSRTSCVQQALLGHLFSLSLQPAAAHCCAIASVSSAA